MRQKFFDGKSRYSPFLIINLLANDNFPKHSTGLFAYDVIRYCETKNFWQKIVILSSSHPSCTKISSILEFFETQKGSPTKSFGTVRQLFFCRKLWYPLLGIKFFDTRIFLEHRKVPTPKVSSTVRQKKLSVNFDTPHFLSINFFATGKILITRTKWFPYQAFQYCEARIFWQKIVILPRSPAFLFKKFIGTWNFVKNRKVPLRKFPAFLDKNIQWKVLILPTLYPETFSLPDFFWNTAQTDSPKNIIGTVRQIFFDGKSLYSPFYS